jgi:Protein of unknown function (DUF4232)
MTSLRMTVVVGLSLVGVVTVGCGSGSSTKGTTAPTSDSGPTSTMSSPTRPPTTPPSTGVPTTTALSGSTPCSSGQLAMSAGQSQGAAGTEILPLVFTNTGAAICTLQGYPGISAIVANGVQLGAPAIRRGTAPGPLVALEPRQTTQAIFTYTDPLIQCQNPITAIGLRVYPPNQTAALFLPTSAVGECPGPPNGNLSIYPIGLAFGQQ